MADTLAKSFAYQFGPLAYMSLTKDTYNNLQKIQQSEQQYWCHFEMPSKNLQQQLSKKFTLPKGARLSLFAEDVRSRCIKVENGYVLIMHGIQPSGMTEQTDFPTLRFWITDKGILSFSIGKIEAIKELQISLKTLAEPSAMSCFTSLLENLIFSLEESTYQIDERLNEIEGDFEYSVEQTQKIMRIRQDIIWIRRYILPQRDALIGLASKLDYITDSTKSVLKELSDGMLRQVESIEMMRERAVIIQDNLTNQIAQTANNRMYIMTIIMLIFTPPFFVMGIFSMYVPIPEMNSPYTWWVVIGVMIALSYGQYKLFKWKRWL
jgi:zinc transporter